MQGEHWHVPGNPTTAHATAALADARALDLVNTMRADAGLRLAIRWRAGLAGLRRRLVEDGIIDDDQGDPDVWIMALDVEEAAHG